MYDFDTIIDRTNTKSLKYDFKKQRGYDEKVIPMWVADMDFKCPDELIDDLNNRVNHGVFGYTKPDNKYFDIVSSWHKKHYNINLKEEWLITTPGVVFALATIVKTITNVGEYVIINNPVYYPFKEVVEDNNRKVISSDLVLIDGKYYIDFNDFEEKVKKHKVKLYILCSPHNPVGRVWSKNELEKILEICKKHGVFIVSDEIHSDFIWKGTHTNLLSYSDYLDYIMLCTSPSKTFNLAGLQLSNTFIPNSDIREAFQKALWATGYSLANIFGIVACESVYTKGEKWLEELKLYLKGNIDYTSEFIKNNIPNITLINTDATYLLWIDFSKINLSSTELESLIVSNAKLWFDNGNMFGSSGNGFFRINIAVPRSILEIALNNLKNAIDSIV